MKATLILSLFLSFSLQAAIYSHPEAAFHFSYDETKWDLVKNDQKEQSDVDSKMQSQTLVSLQSKVMEDKYRARMSFVVDQIKNGVKNSKDNELTQYEKYAVEFLKSQRFTILSQTQIKRPTLSDRVLEIVAYQRDFGLTFRQILLQKSEKVYLVTVAARTKSFESYSKEADKILESLRFAPRVSVTSR